MAFFLAKKQYTCPPSLFLVLMHLFSKGSQAIQGYLPEPLLHLQSSVQASLLWRKFALQYESPNNLAKLTYWNFYIDNLASIFRVKHFGFQVSYLPPVFIATCHGVAFNLDLKMRVGGKVVENLCLRIRFNSFMDNWWGSRKTGVFQ